ncbi:hypothetical protein [Paenibacillus crassostreae]|uniref:Uncharacterized protein n=1 Tax=Paenibacillus crassostreae TaxID=1763538 RepID=A0A167GR04_9BACL|nr:hypothetical protein [Paenibacillus crassostreae]AOZ92016.1 hypothetical protein LPB68_07130 [Paenibacillus crassostreae]OAB77824.1 hypothetical protein PNBC_00210 [Paenibacillus crassostreae]
MNYTYNLADMKKVGNYKVEKQVKLIEARNILKNAIEMFELGNVEQSEFLLRRKADDLLLFSIQSNDVSLVDEVEKLYELSTYYKEIQFHHS